MIIYIDIIPNGLIVVSLMESTMNKVNDYKIFEHEESAEYYIAELEQDYPVIGKIRRKHKAGWRNTVKTIDRV